MARLSPFLICLLLLACTPVPQVVSPTAAPTVTDFPASATASSTAPPPTAALPEATTDAPAPSATATLSQPPAELCSPLGGYTLAELQGIVSQPFIAPRPGVDDGHHGTDFAHYAYKDKTTIAGAPVQALFDGVVAAAIPDSWPYGNFVILESRPEQLPAGLGERLGLEGRSLYHLYAHLEAPPEGLEIKAAVRACAPLGTVGNTGWSGNYHLHLETRLGPPGELFLEMAYYQTTTTLPERENYERWRFGGAFNPLDPMILFGE